MTKKLVEKIKEKEKESKKKKDKKSLPRNKTVSNLRSPLRDREHTKTSTNNTRTLKANKSMGHFLRSHKKDEKSLTLNPESKKKINLKYISRTPKRTEKEHSFYTKTDARTDIKKNEMYNTFNKKSEKKLETNLTLNKKDDKDKDKDKNKKIIKKDDKDKKDEKRNSKKLDTKTKSSQRLSKTINKEKEKKDKSKDKKEGKIEKNKEEKKVGEKKKDKKEENKEEKNKDKKEKTKKNETTKQEKKPEEKKSEEKKKEEKTEKKVEEKKPEEKKVEEKKPEEDKKVEEKKPEEDKKFEVKDEVKKVEEKKPEEKKDEVKKAEEKKLEEEKKIEDKKVEGKKDEEKKEETKELTKEVINEIRTENIENKETKKEIDNKIELSSPPKIEEKKIIPKFIFQRLMNFYDKIHKFLNEEELKNLLLISKDSAISSLPILKEINSSKIQKNEKALNDFKSTHKKEEEYLSTIPSFQLNKAAIKALEKLNEEQNQKLFTSEQTPNKDIIYLYKVFLQLINKFSELKNKNIQDFWKSAKDIIYTSRKGQFGDHIKEMVNQIDFSVENLKIVNDMFKMNKEKFVPKYYSNLCQTTGLFFFLIKEILEYCGIMVGKKTCIPLEYKLLDYELKLNQKNEEKLNKMIEMAHKKKSLFNKNES